MRRMWLIHTCLKCTVVSISDSCCHTSEIIKCTAKMHHQMYIVVPPSLSQLWPIKLYLMYTCMYCMYIVYFTWTSCTLCMCNVYMIFVLCRVKIEICWTLIVNLSCWSTCISETCMQISLVLHYYFTVYTCMCTLLWFYYASLSSQNTSSSDRSYTVAGIWETGVPFLASLNEETPKGEQLIFQKQFVLKWSVDHKWLDYMYPCRG